MCAKPRGRGTHLPIFADARGSVLHGAQIPAVSVVDLARNATTWRGPTAPRRYREDLEGLENSTDI